MNLTLPSGCQVEITYWFRIACNQYYDTQISKIRRLGPACNGISLINLFRDAEIELLKVNPMSLPPTAGVDPDGTCVVTYRAAKASCYTYDPIWSGNIVPCPNFSCCLTSYTVCLVDGERVVTRNGFAEVLNNCDTGGGCHFSCDYN